MDTRATLPRARGTRMMRSQEVRRCSPSERGLMRLPSNTVAIFFPALVFPTTLACTWPVVRIFHCRNRSTLSIHPDETGLREPFEKNGLI